MNIRYTAVAYRRAGLCVLPAIRQEKRPAVPLWKPFQSRLPDEPEVARWFDEHTAMCLVTGAVSGNLEMLDFDLGGEAFDPWYKAVEAADPQLLGRLVIEQSPSGGWHVAYRCQSPVSGNLKLAQRRQSADGPEEVTIAGKRFRPRQDPDGSWHVPLTLIETRGEGGLFLCAPTPGYELLQGDFARVATLTDAERELLLEAAWALNQCIPEPVSPPSDWTTASEGRPGDDFNRRGDVRALLQRHGWRLVKNAGENEYWRRPGKTSGWSATLKGNLFYVFSASASPFEQDRAYAPFSVLALLEHHGDFAAAAAALRRDGFGGDDEQPGDVDLSGLESQLGQSGAGETPSACVEESDGEPSDTPDDPGMLPEEMLRIPGFVGELMDQCLETAPYPNQPMTFCGALALQAFLAGRKVRDPGDNRTNLYILGLAYSSGGKDWIRKLNAKILHRLGLTPCMGDRLASGEGIQDALQSHPSMILLSDEIDGMIQSINKSRDARYEGIMTTLLSLYSSANSIFAMRPKAGKPDPGAIDQPNLVMFGTAIPTHYYAALSERMLTNGFFARQIVVEASKRQEGQEPELIEVSERILATAKWWTEFHPGTGNLQNWHPVPAVVEHTPEAKSLLIETRRLAEAEYSRAEDCSDPVGTTVWGRVSEQVRKLALIYAISENHLTPRISRVAVEWAARFMIHQARRMLFMATSHVSDGEFDHRCKRVLEVLRERRKRHKDGWVTYREISRCLRWTRREHDEVRDALIDQERIQVDAVRTNGRPRLLYRLLLPQDTAMPQ
jgi:hypothetical protein